MGTLLPAACCLLPAACCLLPASAADRGLWRCYKEELKFRPKELELLKLHAKSQSLN